MATRGFNGRLAGFAGVLAVAAGLGCAPAAHATFYSFASDGNSSGFTVSGTAGSGPSFQISTQLVNSYTLLVDDSNGPVPTASIPNVGLVVDLVATHANSQVFVGTLWRHTYLVTGSFRFVDSGGNTLMTATFDAGTTGFFTLFGGQNSWSSTGAILGSDSMSNLRYSWTPALIAALGGAGAAAQLGIVGPNSVTPDDFSFDLTVLNPGTPTAGVQLNAQTKLPTTTWRAEGSFSGSSFVPAPGSAAIAGLAFAAATRRRRR